MEFKNVYEDARRAESYAQLEFPGTYYLAYRDLPEILGEHVRGQKALDFGCGTGRSTRFLRGLGFEVTGVDISPDMLARARAFDPSGDYRWVDDGRLAGLPAEAFDLILSVFTFDNIPTETKKVGLFRELGRVLRDDGRIVNLVSTPEIYTHEWVSFTTREFPDNFRAKPGDLVRDIMLDVPDRRPVDDILWPDEDYRRVFAKAGLGVIQAHQPLAEDDGRARWLSELRVPPWRIYVLVKNGCPAEGVRP